MKKKKNIPYLRLYVSKQLTEILVQNFRAPFAEPRQTSNMRHVVVEQINGLVSIRLGFPSWKSSMKESTQHVQYKTRR